MQSKGTNAAGKKFLEENKAKEGVVVLPSGLQYKVVKKGAGTVSPLVGTSCSCHYRGTLIDGTEFDSSYKRGQPSSFAPNQVIKVAMVFFFCSLSRALTRSASRDGLRSCRRCTR
jgi:FKBP-type peptidyl-prolyl cis-trans isomerase